MDDIYSNYVTGSDSLPGDGSLAHPYKTLAKSISVMSQGDTLYFGADEPVSSMWTLPTYSDYTKVNRIIGTNSSFIVDGTRRTISTSGLTNFLNQTSTYPWQFHNVLFDCSGVSGYFITGNWTPAPSYFNCAWSGGAGVCGVSSTGPRTFGVFDCEFINISTGTNLHVMGLYGGFIQNCKFINCTCNGSGSIVIGSSGQCYADTLLFNGCVIGTGTLVSNASSLRNVIINDCSQGNATTGLLVFTTNGIVVDVLIRNCTGGNNVNGGLIKYTAVGATCLMRNIAKYGCSGFVSDVVALATSKMVSINSVLSLASDPMSDATNLILSPDYPWRRFAQKIGEFNYLPTVI